MTRSHFSIGCLSVTAVVLLVGVLVLCALETQRAEASGMIDAGGSYTVLTGQLNSTNELVYLIDDRTDQLIVYRLNETSKEIQRMQVIQLDDPNAQRNAKQPRLRP